MCSIDNGDMSIRVLVVDDDSALAEMLQLVLEGENFAVQTAADGEEAIEAFNGFEPHIVLLDVMLPGIDGIEVCRRVREKSGVPIIMLTALSDTQDVVRGLEAGADDYVVKPFNPTELIARVRARLREPVQEEIPEHITVGAVEISIPAHEARVYGSLRQLTPLEFRLLAVLSSEPARAFSRDELLEKVWGYRYKADTRLVNVHVQRLRAKIEDDPDDPQIVLTVRGVGYRVNAES